MQIQKTADVAVKDMDAETFVCLDEFLRGQDLGGSFFRVLDGEKREYYVTNEMGAIKWRITPATGSLTAKMHR